MHISGMSGNEIYCLALKGFTPGEIAVGNSVVSLGLSGALSSFGRSITGGEITAITEQISNGRHAAISRMEQEAQRHGASGVTGVVTELGTMAGYTEFLSQGTAVFGSKPGMRFFSTAASGVEAYCHLDAGYVPLKFAMGNIAYALGVGRGLVGSLRTLARGEVREFSSMYNEIRHTCLRRLRQEAAQQGANAVVDVNIRMLPYGPGTVELLMTGTASFHDKLSSGAVGEQQVATSELSGEELWNLAQMGLVPHQLVMATSVYSLGVAAGIGSLFQSMQRGELPEVTKLIYEARENCLGLIRRDAQALGAERVIGNRLQIKEIGSGLVEVVAIGTAVKRAENMKPETPQLIPQAVITTKSGAQQEKSVLGLGAPAQPMAWAQRGTRQAGSQALIGIIIVVFWLFITCFGAIVAMLGRH
jgi:uncharacterized protein YbjQ (UPF0145 family)